MEETLIPLGSAGGNAPTANVHDNSSLHRNSQFGSKGPEETERCSCRLSRESKGPKSSEVFPAYRFPFVVQVAGARCPRQASEKHSLTSFRVSNLQASGWIRERNKHVALTTKLETLATVLSRSGGFEPSSNKVFTKA